MSSIEALVIELLHQADGSIKFPRVPPSCSTPSLSSSGAPAGLPNALSASCWAVFIERAEWWIEQERRQSTTWRRKERLRNAFQAHFSKRYTYEDLREEALNPRQKSLVDEEEPEPSCFCD